MDQFPPSLDDAIIEYEQRQSVRYVEELKLQKAKALMRAEDWHDALRILRPLWQSMSYRREGWWDIVEDVGWSLRTAAAHVGDGESVVAADWELMNSTFAPKEGWKYDLASGLDTLTITTKPEVTIRERDVHSFLSSTFAFEKADGKVADQCSCQLTVTSHASKVSEPLAISEIRIVFDGGLKPILLHHQQSSGSGKIMYRKVELIEGPGSGPAATLIGDQDLSLAPGQSKIYEFTFPLRESGEARAMSATFVVASESFSLDYVVDFDQIIVPDIWWHQKTARKRLVRIDPYLINISPKPPKMDVEFVDIHEQYYTSESISLQLEILNGEDDDSVGKLHVYVSSDHGPDIHLKLKDNASKEWESPESPVSDLSLGTIASGKSTFVTVMIPPSNDPSAFDLIVDLSYSLVSDPETPISKTMSIRLFVVSPFEANYDFSPRYDSGGWPSFFTHEEGDAPQDGLVSEKGIGASAGITQSWCLRAVYASFAVSSLQVTNVDVAAASMGDTISFSSKRLTETGPSKDKPLHMLPNTSEEAKFTVLTQKTSLDDRRSASLDLTLSVSWQRTSDSPINTTLIPVPRLIVASQEPRVLLHIAPHIASSPSTPILMLSYTIENPSMHFLTFGTVMNPSEDFAFSGTKAGTVQLVPLSRRTINFMILPNPTLRGQWIRPVFVVRDRYFQKVLKVSPGDGCRVDKEGVSVWVPDNED